MGPSKANLPGNYRYQRRLFGYFRERERAAVERELFLVDDGISWTASWTEGAMATALNPGWDVVNYPGGAAERASDDLWPELAPLALRE